MVPPENLNICTSKAIFRVWPPHRMQAWSLIASLSFLRSNEYIYFNREKSADKFGEILQKSPVKKIQVNKGVH